MTKLEILLSEYKKIPTLSAEASHFVNNYNGQHVPEHIRKELEKYLQDSESHLIEKRSDLAKIFKQAFFK